MRRAIEQACLLLEHLHFLPQAEQGPEALDLWLAPRDTPLALWRHRGAQAHRWTLVSAWETGLQAQEARQRSLDSAQARAILPGLVAQMDVHLLLQRELPWPALTEPTALIEVTRDVQPSQDPARRGKRPSMPQRDELPLLEGAWIWPVAGHQGRLLMRCAQAQAQAQREALEAAWGPLAEPPRQWSLLPA